MNNVNEFVDDIQKETQESDLSEKRPDGTAMLRSYINAIVKKYGSADKELIELKIGDKDVSFRCYTQEDWEKLNQPVNTAVRIMGKHLNGYPMPDLILADGKNDWSYYVKFFKRG